MRTRRPPGDSRAKKSASVSVSWAMCLSTLRHTTVSTVSAGFGAARPRPREGARATRSPGSSRAGRAGTRGARVEVRGDVRASRVSSRSSCCRSRRRSRAPARRPAARRGIGDPAVEVAPALPGERHVCRRSSGPRSRAPVADDPYLSSAEKAENPSFHPIFLAFRVGPAVVADRDLVEPEARLRELRRELGLDAEAVAVDRRRLRMSRPDHLVAGLHVRQVEVVQDVREPGQEMVARRACQYSRILRCDADANRDPNTTSAFPSRIGATICG